MWASKEDKLWWTVSHVPNGKSRTVEQILGLADLMIQWCHQGPGVCPSLSTLPSSECQLWPQASSLPGWEMAIIVPAITTRPGWGRERTILRNWGTLSQKPPGAPLRNRIASTQTSHSSPLPLWGGGMCFLQSCEGKPHYYLSQTKPQPKRKSGEWMLTKQLTVLPQPISVFMNILQCP